MHVLPQLVMDLVTAGLSSWQWGASRHVTGKLRHCTFRNDRVQVLMAPAPQPRGYPESKSPGSPLAPARRGEEKAADKRGTRVQARRAEKLAAER